MSISPVSMENAQQFSDVVSSVMEGISNSYGVDFFKNLVRQLAESVGADMVYVGRHDSESNEIKTLSLYAHNTFLENISYSPVGGPCATVLSGQACALDSGLTVKFFKDNGITGYLGVPLKDSKGQVLGLVVSLFRKPMENKDFFTAIFKLFAGRIAAEIENSEKNEALDYLNKNLQSALEEAKRVDALKQEFLATIGHELRTPLNGITGALELLGHENAEVSADNFLRIASDSAYKLNQLVNDILSFTEIQAGSLKVKPVTTDLSAFINDCLAPFIDAEKSNLSFHYSIDESVQKSVRIDTRHTASIINHLLDNAFKFTLQGGVTFSSRITEESTGLYLDIEISDSGIGFKEEHLNRVWDPFRQVDGSFSRDYQGVGIGLPLVKAKTELMGGVVIIDSKAQKGTTVEVRIPVELAEGEETKVSAKKSPNLPVKSEYRVLVVEDNAINMKITKKMLGKLGILTEEAINGKVAVDILRVDEGFDLILMDCQMPIMDGFEATRLIRGIDHYENKPIVALTANVTDDDVQNCLDAGMDDHMGKPVSLATLKAVMLGWLGIPQDIAS